MDSFLNIFCKQCLNFWFIYQDSLEKWLSGKENNKVVDFEDNIVGEVLLSDESDFRNRKEFKEYFDSLDKLKIIVQAREEKLKDNKLGK